MKARIILISVVVLIMACSFSSKSATNTPKIATVTNRSLQATSTTPPIQVKPSAAAAFTKTPKQIEPTATYKTDVKIPFSEWTSNNGFAGRVGDVVFQTGQEGKFYANNLKTGDLLWAAEVPNARLVFFDKSIVYTQTSARRIDALDAKTGVFLWRTLFESDLVPLDKFKISDDDKFYVFTTEMPNFHTIDKRSGVILSSQSIPVTNLSPYIYEQIEIFPVTNSLIGFSPQKGEIIWTKELNNHKYKFCEGTLVMYPDGYYDNDIEGFNMVSGELLWTNSTRQVTDVLCFDNNQDPNIVYLSDLARFLSMKPSILLESQSNRIYLLQGTGEVLAIDKNTGIQIWNSLGNATAGGKITNKDAWLGESANEVIYYGKDYGITQAYNAETHELIWENPNLLMNGLLGSSGDSIIGVRFNEYYGTYTVLQIISINKNTGTITWSRDVGGKDVYYVGINEDWLIYETHNSLSGLLPEIFILDVKTGNEKKYIKLKEFNMNWEGIIGGVFVYNSPTYFMNLK